MPPIDPLASYDGADIDGAFRLDVAVRFDNLAGEAWQTVFDFGTPTGSNNISLMQYGNSNDLLFYIFQDGVAYRLVAEDALIEGQVQNFTAGVDQDGTMWIGEGDEIIVESEAVLPMDIERESQLIGQTDWSRGGTLDGEIVDFTITNLGGEPVEPIDPPVPPPADPGDPATPGQIGGAFEIEVTARFDDVMGGYWQRVYDFGNGPATNNIILGQVENTSDMMLEIWQDGQVYRVVAEGAIVEGESATWTTGVDPDGMMWIEKDGVLLAEAQGVIPADEPRANMLVGESNWPDDTPLIGAVSDLTVLGDPLPEDPVDPPDEADEPNPVDLVDPVDPPAPTPPITGAGDMFIVAHQDDDLLFMNPTLMDEIESGGPVTTIYITAGDFALGEEYWGAREDGEKAAYAEMAGVDPSDWVDEIVTIENDGQSYDVHSSYLASQPDVRLYFLRVPDGFNGTGSETYGFESLEKLWDGTIPDVNTVDGAATYTADDLSSVITGIMDLHEPDHIHIQDHESEHTDLEHSDHVHASLFAADAASDYNADYTLTSYYGYATWGFEENIEGAELDEVRSAFLEYAAFDPQVFGSDGSLIDAYDEWLMREYISTEYTETYDASAGATALQAMMVEGASFDIESAAEAAQDDEDLIEPILA
ncbi:PIG-L family deacetylase [Primorskyibacter sp. 2E233]|uniref:PIG-L family deacetylase n=1 Tax=Primorskyibacter sp. 2E233 TaxID=3413431 RepID=UPI003BF2225F